MRKVQISTPDGEIKAEHAVNPFQKMMGMRFRSEGKMLFDLKNSRPILDMVMVPTDLKMYFISSEKISEIIEARKGGLNPLNCRLYKPETSADYLLESSEDLGLETGDEVEIQE